jgi:SAM-dependent methyltransferase
MRLDWFIIPGKFTRIYKKYKAKEFTLLDIGCGNHSPTLTKHWFPQCLYFGVDKEIYNNDPADLNVIEKFYQIDLEHSDLAEIPDSFFDAIIMNHVLEHLTDGLAVLAKLSRKLKPGGKIYLEFPSVKSLSLPSARETLNFCDDPTHVRIYSIVEIVNTLLANGIKIVKAGRQRNWQRTVIAFLLIPYYLGFRLKHGEWTGRGLWDLLGFADFVYGEKRT